MSLLPRFCVWGLLSGLVMRIEPVRRPLVAAYSSKKARQGLIFLLLAALTTSVVNAAPDISGVWVADLTRCDFGVPAHFVQLSLGVTRAGKQLSVVEIAGGEAGMRIAEQRYLFRFGCARSDAGWEGLGLLATRLSYGTRIALNGGVFLATVMS